MQIRDVPFAALGGIYDRDDRDAVERVVKAAMDPAGNFFPMPEENEFQTMLFFYVNAPTSFDHIFLIQNELNRIGHNFFRVPFSLFWKITRGETVADPATIVPQLAPGILTGEQADCVLEFDRLTRLPYKGREDQIARDIIAIYDGFYHALFNISEKTRKLEGTKKP